MKEKLMDVLSNPLNEIGVKIYDISLKKKMELILYLSK